MKTTTVLLVLVAAGFLVSFVTSHATGEVEAWDSPAFFTVTLPVLILAGGIAGYLSPAHFPLWGLGLAAGLSSQILSAAGKVGSMWPVGVLFSLLLALACDAGAWLGAALRKRRLAVATSPAVADEIERKRS